MKKYDITIRYIIGGGKFKEEFEECPPPKQSTAPGGVVDTFVADDLKPLAQELLEGVTEPVVPNGYFIIGWGAKDFGFGEVTFRMRDGKITCDNECMSKEFVQEVFMALIGSVDMRW